MGTKITKGFCRYYLMLGYYGPQIGIRLHPPFVYTILKKAENLTWM